MVKSIIITYYLEIAYLPQQADIDRSFPISVMETVLIGHWKKIGLFRAVTNEMKREAEIALEAVGLIGFENRVMNHYRLANFSVFFLLECCYKMHKLFS